MTNIELASYIVEFIKDFEGAEQALQAVCKYSVPYKCRKAKNYLRSSFALTHITNKSIGAGY